LSLRHSYTLIAPFYDAFLTAATRASRARSLSALAAEPPREVLLVGMGTGLDLPHLPTHHSYTGLDLTPAMLRRARRRSPAASSTLCMTMLSVSSSSRLSPPTPVSARMRSAARE